MRAPLYEASTRIHKIHPSGLPLACSRRDGTAALGLSLEASHPADQEPTSHAEAGPGHRARTWNYTLNITSADPPIDSSLIACDLASHHPTRKRFPARLRLLLLRLGRLLGAAVRANAGASRASFGSIRGDRHRAALWSRRWLTVRSHSGSRRCPGSPGISRCARRSGAGERPTPSSSAHVCGERGHRTPVGGQHRDDRGWRSRAGARSRTGGLRENLRSSR